jgi:hypothetical protein
MEGLRKLKMSNEIGNRTRDLSARSKRDSTTSLTSSVYKLKWKHTKTGNNKGFRAELTKPALPKGLALQVYYYYYC